MVPDIIQAVGIAVAAIIGAWTAWQGRQLKQLRGEVDELNKKFGEATEKLRSAIRHIRDWHRWEMQPDPRGPAPTIPADLVDEV